MEDQQRLARPYTRLSDFGEFRKDVTALATREMKRVGKDNVVPARPPVSIPLSPGQRPNTGGVHANRPGSWGSVRVVSSRPAVIQFPPVTTPQGKGWDNPPKQSVSSDPVTLQSHKRKKKISVAIRVVITLLLFVFLFRSLSWSTFIQALAHVKYGEMLLGLVVGIMGVVVSSYQWRSLLHAERIRFDLADLIDLYMVGIAFNHFLPTGMGGDAVKALQVARTSGNSAGSTSAVVMSRLTGFLGMLLISLPVLVIWHTQFRQDMILWFLLLSLLVLGMISTAIFLAAALPKIYKGKWVNHRIVASIVKTGSALKAAVRRPRAMGIGIGYGAAFWAVSCLNYLAYGHALGIHAPLYFYVIAIPFVSLVTFLPISINGFGLREGAFVYLFSTIHVASAPALLIALFMDAQTLLMGLVGGCIYLVQGRKSNVKTSIQQRQHIA